MIKVIEVENLTKIYDKFKAVDNISFSVNKGEVFGLLGENGAGKTTTLEMIEGLRKPSSGQIKVLGFDVKHHLAEIKERIGVQLQSSAYYKFLRLTEILDLFGSFYKKHSNFDELFQMVRLEHKKKSYINNLSGGQQQRFSIIASLVNDPEIVFLDEPTTGLDPLGRRQTWEIISKIKAQGKTIVLTTHYMEEAEILCDRIAIMEKGKIVALDQTHKLLEKTKHPFKIAFILKKEKTGLINDLKKTCHLDEFDVKKLPGKEAHYEIKLGNQADLNVAVGVLQKENPESLTVGRATLEDVFIELTGKSIDQNDSEESEDENV